MTPSILLRSHSHRRASPCPLPIFVLLLLFLLLVAFFPFHPVTATDNLERQIATHYLNQGYCVRLTHQTDVIGCSTPKDGLAGTIRYVTSMVELSALIRSAPSDRVALLIPYQMLTRDLLTTASSLLPMAGVMVLPIPDSSAASSATPIPSFSPATRRPQFIPYIPSTLAIPDRPTKVTKFNRTYEWNPIGDDIMEMRYDFAIVTVTPSEVDYLMGLAKKNEELAAKGDYIYYKARFSYYMYALDNSARCLDDGTCIPVGGYSVWGSLGNTTYNTTSNPLPPDSGKSLVFLTTKIDSSAFFHQLSPGGDESQASIAVLMGALRTLANVTGISDLPKQIMYGFFQGETYSHVGSRKLVDDIQYFTCQQFEPNGEDGPACASPYKATLAFAQINLDKIETILEVGQIGLNDTVYLHRERDGNARTTSLIDLFARTAENLTTPVTIGAVDADTPGIPPACAEAFLDAKPDIATVVMTDHAGPYVNKYYHSELDTSSNLLFDPPSQRTGGGSINQHPGLCRKATLLARVAYLEAGGDEATSQTIQADCQFIDQLIHCILDDTSCSLIQATAPSAYSSGAPEFNSVAHYTSIYNLLPLKYIDMQPQFLYLLLNTWALNATHWKPPPEGSTDENWPSPPETVHYHDAVDPNLVFDMDANRWRIKSTANDFLLYTESNWDNGVGWKTFRAEDPKMELTTLIIGIGIGVATILSIGAMQKYCAKRFKRL